MGIKTPVKTEHGMLIDANGDLVAYGARVKQPRAEDFWSEEEEQAHLAEIALAVNAHAGLVEELRNIVLTAPLTFDSRKYGESCRIEFFLGLQNVAEEALQKFGIPVRERAGIPVEAEEPKT